MPSGRKTTWTVPLLVGIFTFVVFLPALQNGFVAWDDDKNFLNNPHYRGLGSANLHWMWTTFRLGHYVPLSWMTLGFDYVIWKMDPVGYHLTNIILHSLNAVLVYFLALRLFERGMREELHHSEITLAAAFAALFFALHPLRVESVAWATERRDVLSLFFMLSSILAYLHMTRSDAHRMKWYATSLVLALCALLSKATAMSLPAVLLILNVYPLGRLGGTVGWRSPSARRVYAELAPFLVLSLAAITLSIVALHPPAQLDVAKKIAVSAYGFSFYLWKTIAPTRLAPLYQLPRDLDAASPVFLVSYVVVIAILAGMWLARRRWPALTAALLVFIVIVLPMLGVVQNGPQIAADRYTYHAAPALALLGALVLMQLARRNVMSAVVTGTLILAASSVLTVKQIAVWHDSESLWTRVLDIDPTSAIAHSSWASVLFAQNRIDEAAAHSARAVELDPNDPQARNALGLAFARQGHLEQAVDEFRHALTIARSSDEAENNWGVVSVQQGDIAGAIEHYQSALAKNPDNADAQVNWGNALVRSGAFDDAISHYRAALVIRPDHADAHHNWGVALASAGRYAEAVEQFKQALALNPNHAEARLYLERATQLLQGDKK
jgi:tetratricopeptide (TPR) repeat protein